VSGEDTSDPAGPPEPESERIRRRRPPRRTKRTTLGRLFRLALVLAPVAAVGLGFSHAYSQWKSQPFPADGNFRCPPLPVTQVPRKKTAVGKKTTATPPATQQAAVSEELDIHTRSRPLSFTSTEVVTVPAGNRLAQALILQPGSAVARNAAACLFSEGVTGVPQLTSAAHGMATFKDSSTFPMPVNWEPAVRPGGIQLQFGSELVCNSFPFNDWAGTTLTLRVVSDTVLHSVAPQPDSVSGTTYVWRSPAQGCGKLPQVSVTVPMDLDGYLSSIVNAPGAVGESILPQVLGWLDPVVTGLIALWLVLRIPRGPGKRPALALVALALLGIGPAAVDLALGQAPLLGPAELIAFYSVALGLIVSLRAATHLEKPATAVEASDAASAPDRGPRLLWRAGLVMLVSGACAAAVLVCAYRYLVWFPGASILLTVAAAVLLLAVGAAAFSLARSVGVADESRLPAPRSASVGKVRDLIVFWAAVAALVALAYSAAYWFQIGSVQSAVSSEFSVLRYPLATFGQVLVPIALVLPLSVTGNPGRRVTAAAAFGLAMAANQSDLVVGGGWGVPLGTVLMSVFAYALIREDNTATAPRPGAADAVLAVKVGGLLAVIPVGYFSFTTIASLSAAQTSVFTVSSIIGQFTGWLVIAVFYGMLSSRLPGRIGPFKALILAGVWFAVAIVVNLADNGLHFPLGRSWIFAGLQFSLFLITFSVIWDALAFKKSSVPDTINELRAAYHLEQAQTVALYAIPVLLALVALIQQVASGSGSDFVTSILNTGAAAFGGR
jgi:hypothetical protein